MREKIPLGILSLIFRPLRITVDGARGLRLHVDVVSHILRSEYLVSRTVVAGKTISGRILHAEGTLEGWGPSVQVLCGPLDGLRRAEGPEIG